MAKRFTWTAKVCLALCLGWEVPQAALAAEPTAPAAIWHCSRQPVQSVSPGAADDSGEGFNASGEAIAVTLDDLLAVYSGYPVRVAGKPLFACFMPGQDALSLDALKTLGLNTAAMQMLARKSAIVQRQLKYVTDEHEMQVCMERNFPAFGYLSEPLQTGTVTPCF